MKVGILSFHNAVNYGGVLQVFALQESLKKLGAKTQVIDYENKSLQMSNQLNRKVNLSYSIKYKLLKGIYIKGKYLSTKKVWEEKYKKFEQFRGENLNLTNKKIIDFDQIGELKLDAYVFGSDQIWNPNITGGLDPAYFGGFKADGLKISYAASCGSVSTLMEKKESFLSLVSALDFIATREHELLEFINTNLDKKVVQTLDPTLLLTKKDYEKVSIKPEIKGKYLLIYKLQENKELYRVAKKIAKERNLKIFDISFKPYIRESGINYLETSSPSEFLGLFKNADFIITNSFHGTVFSIINEKYFYTIPHRSVGQRMIDLLNKLKLENRIIYNVSQIESDMYHNINYDNVNKILNEERMFSIQYLRNSLNL